MGSARGRCDMISMKAARRMDVDAPLEDRKFYDVDSSRTVNPKNARARREERVAPPPRASSRSTQHPRDHTASSFDFVARVSPLTAPRPHPPAPPPTPVPGVGPEPSSLSSTNPATTPGRTRPRSRGCRNAVSNLFESGILRGVSYGSRSPRAAAAARAAAASSGWMNRAPPETRGTRTSPPPRPTRP